MGMNVDVCLALMPYASLERPSIAFGILKASLRDTGISCGIAHANLWFAEALGLRMYKGIEVSPNEELIGEWTFAGSLFPDFESNTDEFLSRAIFSLHTSGRFQKEDEPEVRQLLLAARRRATEFVDRAARRVLESQPKIVACSSVFQQHVPSLALLQRIRQLAPGVVTIIGGSNCEGPMGLATLRSFPFVDYVVSGEGDVLFPQLCRAAIERGGSVPMSELPAGVLSRAGQETLTAASVPRAIVADMSLAPTPDYDDYFAAIEASPVRPAITPGLLIETSRGCWWGQKHHCTFCGLNGSGMSYRSKPPERVVAEFEQLASRYGITTFEVVDNILDNRYIRSVMPQLEKSKHDYFIFFETKANLRADELEQLSRAGVRRIQPGIESMQDDALRAIDKGTTAALNVQMLRWAQRYGIQVSWLLLVGFPGERDEWYSEMAEIFPLITHLQPPSGITRIQFHRFSPYFDRAAEYGLDLVPGHMYPYVYPFPTEVLADLAYCFDDLHDAAKLDPHAHMDVGAGMRSAMVEVARWGYEWKKPFNPFGPARPEMRMSDDGERISITDTRAAAVEVFWELHRWSRRSIASAIAPSPGRRCSKRCARSTRPFSGRTSRRHSTVSSAEGSSRCWATGISPWLSKQSSRSSTSSRAECSTGPSSTNRPCAHVPS